MIKIPVGATIAHAYRFAFGNFFSLVKLLWLPLLAVFAAQAITTPHMAAVSAGLQTQNFSAMTAPGWLGLVLAMAITWILSFMLITACFQFALDQPEAQGRGFYFSFAMPLWRFLAAFLLLMLVMAALLVVYLLACLLVLFLFRFGLAAAHVSDTALAGIVAFDTLLAFLVGYCGAIFCFVRFGFLLGATTIAEGRIGLFRSWSLSHHNFWRMFLVTLAVFLPLIVLQMLGFYALGFFPHIPPGASMDQIKAAQAAASQASMGAMARYWYIVYPIFLVITLLTYGMMAGAGSFAWRKLTGTDA